LENLESLVEALRVRRKDIRATLTVLHRQGLVDVLRMRLSFAGFAIGTALLGQPLRALRAAPVAKIAAAERAGYRLEQDARRVHSADKRHHQTARRGLKPPAPRTKSPSGTMATSARVTGEHKLSPRSGLCMWSPGFQPRARVRTYQCGCAPLQSPTS